MSKEAVGLVPAQAPRLVVGIGASAGGLEALERLFEATPVDTGLAFVVVQHLSPDFKSLTNDILARRTRLPIRVVEDGMPVLPDAAYLIPPRKDMIIRGGRLLLTDKDLDQLVALPIDHFFRSVAQEAGDRAVAVILSGTGSDGSRGVRDVRQAGGLVVVQDPDTAKFDGMPRSALDAVPDALVLAPEAIPAALARHALLGYGAGAAEPSAPAVGVDGVFRLLRDAYGIDFSFYKPETVARWLERRLGLSETAGLDAYAHRLADDPAELNLLYKDLMIGVTRFFRDEEAFTRIGREVLPALLGRLPPGDEFRLWVAGCATGEEAYSLAVLVREAADALPRPVPVKIFATDAHRASLDVAGAGVYPEAALAGMSPERLTRFFARTAGGYQVSAELRKMVVFAQHNVLKDAPFTRLDLVSCRNLLIYFQPAAQKRVLSLFHFALKTGGALFLGPSETTGEVGDEFEPIDPHWRVYRKRRDVRLSTDMRLTAVAVARPAPGPTAPADPHLSTAYDALLDMHMPPALLVNERGELAQTFAGASKFLKLRDGRVTTDLLSLVDPEFRTALSGALPRAFRELAEVTFRGLRVSPPGGRAGDRRDRPPGPQPAGRGDPRHRPGERSRRAPAGPRPAPGDRPRAGVPGADPHPRGRPPAHPREPPGDDRGDGDEQRGAPGHQPGADRGERGTPEHERGAPLGQRGTVHGQWRVPEEDRGADPAVGRHGQPPGQHRGPHDLPRPRPVPPEVHPEDRRDVQPAPAGPRPADRPLHLHHRPPRAAGRPASRARPAHPGRAAGAGPAGELVPPPHPPVPGRAGHRRGGAHPGGPGRGEAGGGRGPAEGRPARRHPAALPELGVHQGPVRALPSGRRVVPSGRWPGAGRADGP